MITRLNKLYYYYYPVEKALKIQLQNRPIKQPILTIELEAMKAFHTL